MFEEIFARKKIIPKKLIEYGFEKNDNKYTYITSILEDSFLLKITIDEKMMVDTSLTEKDTGEEYVLYKTSAQGSFVGEVRSAISQIIQHIAEKCFEPSVFKQEQTLCLLDYVSLTYGDELEYLWKKFPDNGVWRRKDTGKWYGAILKVKKSKLGIDSDEMVEILDLHTSAEKMDSLLKQKYFYPGWHMSKKTWYTIILDGSISNQELYQRIEESYLLATK